MAKEKPSKLQVVERIARWAEALKRIGWVAVGVVAVVLFFVNREVEAEQTQQRVSKLEKAVQVLSTHAQAISEQVAVDRALLEQQIKTTELLTKKLLGVTLGPTEPQSFGRIRNELGRVGG